jgi:hypothetical protein
MDRRDTFKSLLIGGLAGGFIVQGCVADAKEKKKTAATATADSGPYGRTEKEKRTIPR